MSIFPIVRPPILSPCVGLCRLGVDGLCEGCRRNGEEIAGWLGYSDEERRRIIEVVLPQRGQRRGDD